MSCNTRKECNALAHVPTCDSDTTTQYIITLQSLASTIPPEIRLRQALKALLRSCQLRCTSIESKPLKSDMLSDGLRRNKRHNKDLRKVYPVGQPQCNPQPAKARFLKVDTNHSKKPTLRPQPADSDFEPPLARERDVKTPLAASIKLVPVAAAATKSRTTDPFLPSAAADVRQKASL